MGTKDGKLKPKTGQPVGSQKGGEDVGDDNRAEEAANQLGKLHALTGQPLPADEVLYALTMCAPYTAVTGPYQFRVKLTQLVPISSVSSSRLGPQRNLKWQRCVFK